MRCQAHSSAPISRRMPRVLSVKAPGAILTRGSAKWICRGSFFYVLKAPVGPARAAPRPSANMHWGQEEKGKCAEACTEPDHSHSLLWSLQPTALGLTFGPSLEHRVGFIRAPPCPPFIMQKVDSIFHRSLQPSLHPFIHPFHKHSASTKQRVRVLLWEMEIKH